MFITRGLIEGVVVPGGRTVRLNFNPPEGEQFITMCWKIDGSITAHISEHHIYKDGREAKITISNPLDTTQPGGGARAVEARVYISAVFYRA